MYTKEEIKEFKDTIPEGVTYQMIADACESFVTLHIIKNFFGLKSTSDDAAIEIVKKTKVAIDNYNAKTKSAKDLLSI